MGSIFRTGSEKDTPVRPCTRAARSSSASASGRMSAGRARNAGTGIVSTLSRKNKSSRNCPSETRRARSALVRAIRRAVIVMVSVPPRRSNCRSSSTRKKFRLRGRRKRRDFIQHDRSRARHFQAAEFALDRSGKCAALVPEQFRFDQFLRQAGTIDFQEGRIAPGSEFVDQARQMILAGAALSGDEKRGGSFRDLAREFDDRLRRGIFRDPGHARLAHPSASAAPSNLTGEFPRAAL